MSIINIEKYLNSFETLASQDFNLFFKDHLINLHHFHYENCKKYYKTSRSTKT